MITITLEGGCWQDILDEMTIVQKAARGPGIETDYKKGACPACADILPGLKHLGFCC